MSQRTELHERLRLYYTTYYRDVLGIPSWRDLVAVRQSEERQEHVRLARLRRLLGSDLQGWHVLNVGCGTGGFNESASVTGIPVVGVDEDAGTIAICARRRQASGGQYVQAVAERLPFRDGTFDLVYCFSVIEHVASVEGSIREMVRVTRPGGAVYVHTPSAWSWYEGHYKIFWVPFLPGPLARVYLALRGRPTAYFRTIRRLTVRRLRRAFAGAGVDRLELYADTRPREARGPFAPLAALYYRLPGMTPFIEMVARKP